MIILTHSLPWNFVVAYFKALVLLRCSLLLFCLLGLGVKKGLNAKRSGTVALTHSPYSRGGPFMSLADERRLVPAR